MAEKLDLDECEAIAKIAYLPQDMTLALIARIRELERAASPAALTADPAKCTAVVDCANGRITTQSCTTKTRLINLGSSHDDERDYYRCPDCGKHITIDYREGD